MTGGTPSAEPRRLVAEDDPAGLLLRRADEVFREGLAAGPAWQRFQARKSRTHSALWLIPAAATVLLLVTWRARPRAALVISDPLTVTAEPVAVRPSGAEVAQPPPALERRIPPLESQLLAPRPVNKLPNRAVPEFADDATCRVWSNAGKLEQAIPCFQGLSRGSGVKAEVALYEAARLSGERLHDARRALVLLDEHRRRFPESALRGEVEWLRVRSLERAGRLAEALSVSEELLATPAGRPLASKLHLLRGQIYAGAQADCAHAVREYVALLGEPGQDGDDAEFLRAQCLERLARAGEARAAYERYLERPDVRWPALAKQRLLELQPEHAPGGQP